MRPGQFGLWLPYSSVYDANSRRRGVRQNKPTHDAGLQKRETNPRATLRFRLQLAAGRDVAVHGPPTRGPVCILQGHDEAPMRRGIWSGWRLVLFDFFSSLVPFIAFLARQQRNTDRAGSRASDRSSGIGSDSKHPDGQPHETRSRMGSLLSKPQCDKLGVAQNCTYIPSANGEPAVIGGLTKGQFQGDPDIAGIGVRRRLLFLAAPASGFMAGTGGCKTNLDNTVANRTRSSPPSSASRPLLSSSASSTSSGRRPSSSASRSATRAAAWSRAATLATTGSASASPTSSRRSCSRAATSRSLPAPPTP